VGVVAISLLKLVSAGIVGKNRNQIFRKYMPGEMPSAGG
jgi:hypothetical protein